jgi:hypothetical protein
VTQQLLGYAKHEFELDRIVEGHTLRSQLELAAAHRPTYAEKLRNPEEIPPGLERLWGWFLEISSVDRIYADGGFPLPISSLSIWAWCQLRGFQLEPWEVRLIRLLDTAWLTAHRKQVTGNDAT